MPTDNSRFFANPLDAGTNNTIDAIFGTNVPNGTTVYKFVNGAGWTINVGLGRFGWSDASSPVGLAPGEGCFVLLPTSSIGSPPTITCVGNVLQGTLTNNNIGNGFSVLGSMIPVQNTLDSTGNGGIGYAPANGDNVYQWDPVGQQWLNHGFGRFGWDSDPIISPGSAFFLNAISPSPTWVQTFTVQ